MSQTSIREVIAKPKRDKTPMVSNLLKGPRTAPVRPKTSPVKGSSPRKSKNKRSTSPSKNPWNPPGNSSSSNLLASSKNLLKMDSNRRRSRSRSKSPSKNKSQPKFDSPPRPQTAVVTRFEMPEISELNVNDDDELLPNYRVVLRKCYESVRK